jgi:H+/Cl- antiporter ClcA
VSNPAPQHDEGLLTVRHLKSRLVFWTGAVLVGLAAVAFAIASEHAVELFKKLVALAPWAPLIVSPLGLILVTWLTRRFFPGAQGSGIPQTIATLDTRGQALRDSLLSIRIAIGKILLTILGLLSGASIGREGPTVHIGAAIMHSAGRLAHFPPHYLERGLILAGGAAGISAAFNTPLAGIVFAIEEISRSFEERNSGTVITAVILAGVTAVVIQGNYTYFGSTNVTIDMNSSAWLAALLCGIVGGLLGGGFSTLLIKGSRWVAPWHLRRPYRIALLCGLSIGILGWLSGGLSYGTGYDEARQLVTGENRLDWTYPISKLLATVASYLSGIPGGIFAPSLATGAGFGAIIAEWFPHIAFSAVVILGMTGYFAGVVQTPLTAMVIIMEMTNNQSMLLPIMATAFIAYGVSRMVCREPIYRALAWSFLETQEPAKPTPEKPPAQRDTLV